MHTHTHIFSLTRASFASSPQGGLETCHNACIHLHTHIHICMHTYTRTDRCIYYMYIYMYIYMCVYEYHTVCCIVVQNPKCVNGKHKCVCGMLNLHNMQQAHLCLPFTH